MDYSAANGELWSLVTTLGIVSLVIGAALLVRARFAFVRRSMMPTAVLGGFLLLLAKETGLVRLNEAILEMLVYHTIGLGFISMSLRRALRSEGPGKRENRSAGFKAGAIIVGTYLVQAFAGLIISIPCSLASPRVLSASGLLLPMGFGQGPGQANNIGSAYEALGFAGSRSYALAIAAAGYLCACTMGVVILHRWSRLPGVKSGQGQAEEKEPGVSMFQVPHEIPISDSIDRFSVQCVLVLSVYLVTYLITRAVTGAVAAVSPGLAATVNSLLWGFNFIFGSAFALLAGKALDGMRSKGWMKREYRNNYLLSRLSGFFFDLMIACGIASIHPEDIAGLWVPFILTVAAGAAVTWIYLKWCCKRAFPGYEREGLISLYGMLTGTIGSGILLLREIDPELSTPAANNLVIGSSYGIVLGAPMLVFISLAARSLGMCLMTFALIVVYGLLLSWLVGGKLLGRKEKAS